LTNTGPLAFVNGRWQVDLMPKPKGATPKSIQTREAIEAAAKELFSAKGYEGASLRDIALRAGIDASMIIRYFGSKDALFARVAMPDLCLPDMSDVRREDVGQTLVRHFLEQWEDSGSGLPILLRSASSNAEAAQRLVEVFRSQVLPAIVAVGAGDAPRRAGLVASQLLGLAMTRYVLKLPPMVEMPREVIIGEIGTTVQRYLSDELK
jgi:AcrR family transcriptional regulator